MNTGTAYQSMLYVVADLLQLPLAGDEKGFSGTTKRPVKFGPGEIQVPLNAESDELSNSRVSFRLRFFGDLGGYLIVDASRKARLYMFDATLKGLVFSKSVEKVEPFLKQKAVAYFELVGEKWTGITQ